MILSIESSCDDSSIAITKIETKKLLFHKKISQDDQHSIYGGVVPELAARLHAEALPKILEEISPFFPDIKAVAITNEPGLSVTLVEGVAMAKAISISLNIPLIKVNHLMGHIYSLFIEKEENFPQSILLVSGGHTQIFEVLRHNNVKTIAKTMDDSFGESFDKVAKMLGLGYPGGGIVEGLARKGDERSYDFTIPLSNSPLFAFSYSGLKNQVRIACDEILKTKKEDLSQQEKNNICASFQRVAVEHLVQKIKKYFKQNKPTNFAIVGGASQNLYLRKKIDTLCREFNIKLSLAPVEFCSDNAAMIGRLGVKYFELGEFVKLEDLGINPTSSI